MKSPEFCRKNWLSFRKIFKKNQAKINQNSKLEIIPETELLPLLDRVMEAAMAKVETLTGVAMDSQSDSEERKMVDKSVSTLLALMTFWVREAVDPADKRGGEIIKKVNEWTGGHIRDRVGEKAGFIFGHCFYRYCTTPCFDNVTD